MSSPRARGGMLPADRLPEVAALVTAFRRPAQTLETISRILSCVPAPAELLVHIDGGNDDLANVIRDRFPTARIFTTASNIGAGASRNILLREARSDLCASFDDESYPVSEDYFRRVATAFVEFQDAWVLAAQLRDKRPIPRSWASHAQRVATFSGGACAYRRSFIERTGGYVPILIGYAMEELDLSLRIHALGGHVVYVPDLVVFHDSDLSNQSAAAINAASLTNVALHCFLRYPPALWPVGGWQVLNRLRWAIGARRFRGLLKGILDIPAVIWRYRGYRQPVALGKVLSFLRLKKRPIALPSAAELQK